MFDIGFSEILLIGVIALIVIGPERLPKVARTVGLLLGRVQRYITTVKADISQEMQLEELHRASTALKDSMQAAGQAMNAEVTELHNSIKPPVASADTPGEHQHEPVAGEGVQAELALEPVPHSIDPHSQPAEPTKPSL